MRLSTRGAVRHCVESGLAISEFVGSPSRVIPIQGAPLQKPYQPIGLDHVVTRDAALPATRVDDDLVILNIATGRYIGLDDIGRHIWDMIEAPMRVGDICEALAQQYRGDADAIAADAKTFLEELAGEGIIRVDG